MSGVISRFSKTFRRPVSTLVAQIKSLMLRDFCSTEKSISSSSISLSAFLLLGFHW
ncbi:MAG: hypothetical protein BWX45_00060 [Deltaproteobacteria bacterium ADurb.Bin002]|nr:MAG: hypothetical protein BWX45_00060 [Deltaproteobacteria bacterium ADurb.Bin002]